MKLIYTNENRFLVSNVKNIIQDAGIEVMLKNEYIGGGAGDLSPFDTWLELWVVEDRDYDRALKLVDSLENPANSREWMCSNCREINSDSFDICWQCQNEKPLL